MFTPLIKEEESRIKIQTSEESRVKIQKNDHIENSRRWSIPTHINTTENRNII
jgi:hypothetical protein